MIEVSREAEVLFLSNKRGRFALSVDGGETAVLPSGVSVQVEGSVWGEADDDDEAERNLSEAQLVVLREVRARPPARGIEAIALRHRNNRRALRGYYAKADRPIVEVPEGALVVKSDLDD